MTFFRFFEFSKPKILGSRQVDFTTMNLNSLNFGHEFYEISIITIAYKNMSYLKQSFWDWTFLGKNCL